MKFILYSLPLLLFSCNKDDVSIYNKWKLQSYVKGSGEITKSSGFFLQLDLQKDETYSAELNQNSCFGTFTKGADEITFENSNCDSICCDSIFSMEAYTLLMDSVKQFEITGDNLKLKGNHFTTLHFLISK